MHAERPCIGVAMAGDAETIRLAGKAKKQRFGGGRGVWPLPAQRIAVRDREPGSMDFQSPDSSVRFCGNYSANSGKKFSRLYLLLFVWLPVRTPASAAAAGIDKELEEAAAGGDCGRIAAFTRECNPAENPV